MLRHNSRLSAGLRWIPNNHLVHAAGTVGKVQINGDEASSTSKSSEIGKEGDHGSWLWVLRPKGTPSIPGHKTPLSAFLSLGRIYFVLIWGQGREMEKDWLFLGKLIIFVCNTLSSGFPVSELLSSPGPMHWQPPRTGSEHQKLQSWDFSPSFASGWNEVLLGHELPGPCPCPTPYSPWEEAWVLLCLNPMNIN